MPDEDPPAPSEETKEAIEDVGSSFDAAGGALRSSNTVTNAEEIGGKFTAIGTGISFAMNAVTIVEDFPALTGPQIGAMAGKMAGEFLAMPVMNELAGFEVGSVAEGLIGGGLLADLGAVGLMSILLASARLATSLQGGEGAQRTRQAAEISR